MEKIGFRIPLLLSLGLFGLALFLPVYGADSGTTAKGWLALVGGWAVGVSDPPTAVSWFANVTFVFAVIFILKRKNPKPMATLIFAVASVILGCSFLGAGASFGGGNSEIMTKAPIGTSFFAWMGSFVMITLAAWIKYKKR